VCERIATDVITFVLQTNISGKQHCHLTVAGSRSSVLVRSEFLG
jgi:hypothetical protein